MSINHAHLRAFHAVATSGSFTRAARSLNVSQPTVSDQVKSLEQRYDVRLFERSSRRVALTALGRALHAVTIEQFALESEAEKLLGGAHGLGFGRLRVGADAPYLVTPLLAAFKRRHPQVQLSVTYGNGESVLAGLLERRFDVAMLPEVAAPGDLHVVEVRRDRIVAFVERGHPWSKRGSVTLPELVGQTLVLREVGSRTRATFERAVRAAGLDFGDVLEIGSREGVREAVAAGLGAGVVSLSELGFDRRVHALPIRHSGLRVAEHAVCMRERRTVRVVAAFFEILHESLAAGVRGGA